MVEASRRVGTIAAMVLLSIISVPLVFAIATFPGEWLDGELRSLPPIAPLRKMLVAGEIDEHARKPKSLWSDRLVLPGLDVIDHTKLDTEAKVVALPVTASLRARHLEGAVLIGAGLRKADLTGSYLEGAILDGADLRAAKLDNAALRSAFLPGAQLQDASLVGSDIQSADLSGAQLQGASLRDVWLDGADLSEAQLPEASLDGAQLAGAKLDRAQLQTASIRKAFVWRTDVRTADTTDARIIESEPKTKFWIDWSARVFRYFTAWIEKTVPENELRKSALSQVGILDPEMPLPGKKQMAGYWDQLQSLSPAPDIYEEKLARQWRLIGCSADGAPYVLTGLIATMWSADTPFSPDSVQVPLLAADFLKDDCAGARGLSDDAKAKLKALRDRAARGAINPSSQTR